MRFLLYHVNWLPRSDVAGHKKL